MGCPWKERFEAVTSSRTQPHLACTAIFRCLREELRSHGESRIYGSSGVCDNPVTQKTFRHNSIRPEPQGCESRMGLPVALSLAFPASTQQRRKPLQCHRFPRARGRLLARETHLLPPTCQNTNPGAPLQSASCRRQAALPRTRAALFHEAEQLRFPSSLFRQTRAPSCALSALPSLQSVFENFLKRNFGIFCAIWRCEFLP